MAVVSSGQIRLNADVNVEINGSIGTNVSLSSLSTGASKSAPHGLFEFYGYTSADPPQNDVQNITSLTSSSMQVNCYIQNNGGAPITSYGIYFGTNPNCSLNTKYTVGTGNIVYWNKNFTGLSSGTTYYMQSWAANSAGERIGQRCVSVATSLPALSSVTSYTWGSGSPGSSSNFDGQGNSSGSVFAQGQFDYFANNSNTTMNIYCRTYAPNDNVGANPSYMNLNGATWGNGTSTSLPSGWSYSGPSRWYTNLSWAHPNYIHTAYAYLQFAAGGYSGFDLTVYTSYQN